MPARGPGPFGVAGLFFFYFLVFALFIHFYGRLNLPLGAGLAQHVVLGIQPWSLPLLLPKLS